MAVNYGQHFMEITQRTESYAEFTELTWKGNSYIFCVTALYPYKDYASGSDRLRACIDFRNLTQGISGRFPDVTISARKPQDNDLRRFAAIRKLKNLIKNNAPQIPSPIYP